MFFDVLVCDFNGEFAGLSSNIFDISFNLVGVVLLWNNIFDC